MLRIRLIPEEALEVGDSPGRDSGWRMGGRQWAGRTEEEQRPMEVMAGFRAGVGRIGHAREVS